MSLNRVQRLNALIKKEISQIILRDFDFVEDVLITITRAKTTPNLIQAKVYVSVMPEKKGSEVLRALKRNIYEIQQKINKRLKMRPVPRIEFKIEEKIREAGRIEEILEGLKNKEK